MTPAEAQVLLSMAAAVDNRKPDADAAKAWAAMLDDLRFEDCRVAVIEHFKTSNDWLMPAMIRTAVKRMRAKRLHDHGPLTPPPDLGTMETLAWRRDADRRIGDGEVIDCDAAYGELKPRNLSELRALMPKPEPAPETTPDEAQEGAR
jgi:hypothetical protein